MSADVREVAIIIDGKTRFRFPTQVGNAEVAMELAGLIAKMRGRVAVVVTGPNLVSEIVCRSRS